MPEQASRYSRQVIFPGIGKNGQARLEKARVVLVGCGADGSCIADRLVRAGVGHLTVIDRDFIELNNLQRQVLYDEDDLAAHLPKAVAAERKLRRINSQVEVTGLVTDFNLYNAETLINQADLVMDGTDNFDTRYLINDACVKLGIPWIYCGVVASNGMTVTIVPHQTPCLRCLFPDPPPAGTSVTCDVAGIANPIVTVVAGMAAAEGIKLLVGRGNRNEGIIYIDLWENTFNILESGPPRENCPTCGRGRFDFLQRQDGPNNLIVLCGRDSVQIRPNKTRSGLLKDLIRRLPQPVDVIVQNDYLVRFIIDRYEMVVFDDGRAIIQGTQDEGTARSLYARFVEPQL